MIDISNTATLISLIYVIGFGLLIIGIVYILVCCTVKYDENKIISDCLITSNKKYKTEITKEDIC